MPYLNTSIMFKKLNAWLKPGGLLIYNTPEVCSRCFEHSKCSHMLSPLAFYVVHLLAQECLVIWSFVVNIFAKSCNLQSMLKVA